jgi:hypothetical protein
MITRSITCALVLTLCVCPALTQQLTRGKLRGHIKDELGGLVVGAVVTATEQGNGKTRTGTTDQEGSYAFGDLAPGKYVVRVTAPGFDPYENEVAVVVGPGAVLDIQLSVGTQKQDVTVGSDKTLGLDEHNRADTVVLTGQTIEALPDDPDELAAALQALAGPAVGPNGGQLTIDGFEGGRTPPKSSIREIRLNDNPMAAERDQPGFGGIQIITKPGTDRLHVSAYTSFMDESLNSRNPFAPSRAPFQLRQFGGNLSGSIKPKRDSYFLDAERNETDDNDIVNATILDSITLRPVPFVLSILTPTRNTTFSPRFDLQINPNHTLVTRYAFLRTSNRNLGVGGFSLPSRAYEASRTQHTFQITETAVLNATTVNELRFQFIHGRRQSKGSDLVPAVNVQESFINGDAQIGLTFLEDTRFELTDIVTIAHGNHSIRFGGRMRKAHLNSVFDNNFGGTFIFAGGLAPEIQFDANNQIVRDGNGNPVLGPIAPVTSLERYRRTILLQSQGFTPPQVSALGGGPSQFTISGGNPRAAAGQFDVSGFIQDEWRWRPNFTITAGLRYETQTNINSPLNFAPRVFFAWAPDGSAKRQAKTVIRGGAGIFYDRFNEGLTLESRHFSTDGESTFIVTDPAVLSPVVFTLNGVSNVPSLQSLAGSQRQIIRLVAGNLQAPYSYTAGLLFERQLPKKFLLSSGFLAYRTRHAFRSRNINSPLPGTFSPAIPGSGVFPLGNVGPRYVFESDGVQTVSQWQVGIQNRLLPAFTIFANYALFKATGNTGGPFSFPANTYDLRSEYGRSSFDVRHRFTLTGTITVQRLKLILNPIIIASSGRPFDITTGRDNNGDGLFTDRPAIAGANTNLADVRSTAFGDFDLNPRPGQEIIPRNFGHSPGFLSVNLRITRQFKFGDVPQAAAASPRPGGGGAGQANSGGPSRGPGGGSAPAARKAERPYTLTLSLSIQNLLNNTNLAPPIGNLSSPFFGQSLSSFSGGFGGTGSAAAGNRRLQASVRVNF